MNVDQPLGQNKQYLLTYNLYNVISKKIISKVTCIKKKKVHDMHDESNRLFINAMLQFTNQKNLLNTCNLFLYPTFPMHAEKIMKQLSYSSYSHFFSQTVDMIKEIKLLRQKLNKKL